ncbi:MAG: ankyrin repeat domain-containing protein [Epsilonproteobacteria bacterium]|nr:ankyrin repeat domain-containing protein [Campylobacterota bacterium]
MDILRRAFFLAILSCLALTLEAHTVTGKNSYNNISAKNKTLFTPKVQEPLKGIRKMLPLAQSFGAPVQSLTAGICRNKRVNYASVILSPKKIAYHASSVTNTPKNAAGNHLLSQSSLSLKSTVPTRQSHVAVENKKQNVDKNNDELYAKKSYLTHLFSRAASFFAALFSKKNAEQRKPESKDVVAVTTLSQAGSSEETESVQSEIVKNVDSNKNQATKKIRGWTQLHDAVQKKNIEMVRLLLQEGHDIDVNAQTHAGWTPLHYVVSQHYLEMAELLVSSGANVNAKTDAGWTVLHYAAYAGDCRIVKFLLEKGADIDDVDASGKSALSIAFGAGKSDVVACLLDWGAKDKSGIAKKKFAVNQHVNVQRPSDYFGDKFGQKTQTGSLLHLLNNEWKDVIDKKFTFMVPHVEKSLIGQIRAMAALEREHACAGASATDSHIVLYHRQPGLVSFMHDIFFVLGGKSVVRKVPLRIAQEGHFLRAKNIDELDKQLKLSGIHDHHHSNILVSTNPTLFSNVNCDGESSFLQFIDADKPFIGFAYQGDFDRLLDGVCRYLHVQLTEEEKQTACEVYKQYYQDKNSLLQLFIPKEKVKDYCYLSRPYGRTEFCNDILGRPPTYSHSVDDFFTLLKNDQKKLYPWIGKNEDEEQRIGKVAIVQLRLYPHPDYFLSNTNDLKWRRYDYLLDEQKLEQRKGALISWAQNLSAKCRLTLATASETW